MELLDVDFAVNYIIVNLDQGHETDQSLWENVLQGRKVGPVKKVQVPSTELTGPCNISISNQ